MVRIVTDSSTLYTIEDGKREGFDSLPLCVSIGECHERDLQIDMEEFYQKISSGLIPTSSQPPIGDELDVYEAYPEDTIINIAMADGLSGTYQSACSARQMAHNPERITVFNSRTLCGPHRYMVEEAQKMKEEGKTAEEILAWLETAAEQTESFLIPQDFSFLRRGGRLTPLAAAVGSLLKLKPIVKQTEDGKRLDRFGMKRTMSAAVESIIEHCEDVHLGADYVLYISHADAQKEAEKMKGLFEERFQSLEVRMLELSPVFVAQGGPQCVAIQYIKRRESSGQEVQK